MRNLNACILHPWLHQLPTPDRPSLNSNGAMIELTHVLCQYGEPMWKQRPEHTAWVSNLQAGVPPPGIGTGGQEYSARNYAYTDTKGRSSGPGMQVLQQTKKEVPVETASECCPRETCKVFVGGMP